MNQPTTRRRTAGRPRAHVRDERLPLVRHGPSRPGYPDGAWSPRSTNLVAELPPLLADLGRQAFLVDRVVYNPALWGLAPGRMASGTGSVWLDPSDELSHHVIRLLLSDDYRCIDLLVHFPSRREPARQGVRT